MKCRAPFFAALLSGAVFPSGGASGQSLLPDGSNTDQISPDAGQDTDTSPPNENIESSIDPDNTDVDTRSVDEIFRAVFGSDRPALESDEYYVRFNGVNTGSYLLQPPETGSDEGWVSGAFVDTMLLPSVVPQLQARLRELGGAEQVSFSALRALGIGVNFDEQKLVLEVVLPPELSTQQVINLRALAKAGTVDYIRQAFSSGYLNFRAGVDVLEDSETRDTGVDRLALDIDGALRIGPLVLEGEIDYDDRRSERKWRRGDLLLSFDDRNSLIRYEAGDLSIGNRPFQGSPRIAGLAAYRKYSINPYINTRPVTGREFQLDQGARVEVIVNGLPLRTIDLPSGQYRLQDFPLVPSAVNDIRLRITYPSGRVEELEFPAFYDFELLAKGRTDFGVNAGVPYRTQNGLRDYDTHNYNLLAYYRRGITDTLTLGANIETDETFATVGIEATWASPIGTFSFNLADDVRNPGPGSGQATLQYRWRDANRERDRSIDGFIQLTGKDFKTLDRLFGENFIAVQGRIRAGQYVGKNMRAQIFAGYEKYHSDNRDTYTVGGSLTGSIGRFQIGGSLEYRNGDEGREFIGQLSVAARFGRTSVVSSYSTDSNTMRAQFSRTDPYAIGAVNLAGSVERSDRSDRQSLRASYVGNRFEASAQQQAINFLTPNAANTLVTELRMGTALVMADGHFALSRPVSNSFAIFDSGNEDSVDLAVDPQARLGGVESSYLARNGALGPAVVNNITPYYNRRIRIDTADDVAKLSNNLVSLNADYRSGYIITSTRDGSVGVLGNLVDLNGEPVGLATGTYRILGRDGSDSTATFFTNRSGRFYIEGLEPGETIEIELRNEGATGTRITIPDDAAGLVTFEDPISLSVDFTNPESPEKE